MPDSPHQAKAPESSRALGSSRENTPALIDPRPIVERYPGPRELRLSEAERSATEGASARVRRLLENLAGDSRIAFGHQDSTAYGIGWSGEGDRSDTKSVCGSHPAVRGWDAFGIEKGAEQNGDGVRFALMRERILEAHAQGAINTISWHLDNPASGGDAWNTESAMGFIQPGQSHHEVYRVYLDRLADFLVSLRDEHGALVPIIFRPFHEHTGSWFWWGGSHSTEQQFVDLWRFTVDHLRHQRGLTHLMFAFSPGAGDVHDERSYLFRYPGDAYVDVMGLDHYYLNDASGLVEGLRTLVRVARTHGKIPALTEFGARDGLSNQAIDASDWFRRSFFEPIVKDPTASRIAYALAWRNGSRSHFFVPHPGHPGAAGFKAICDDPRFLLESDLGDL